MILIRSLKKMRIQPVSRLPNNFIQVCKTDRQKNEPRFQEYHFLGTGFVMFKIRLRWFRIQSSLGLKTIFVTFLDAERDTHSFALRNQVVIAGNQF